MAAINGLVKRQVTLAANTEQTIEFATGIQRLSIANMGTAKVAYKVGATLESVSDDTANYITSDIKVVDIYKSGPFTSISLIADAECAIQWDIT